MTLKFNFFNYSDELITKTKMVSDDTQRKTLETSDTANDDSDDDDTGAESDDAELDDDVFYDSDVIEPEEEYKRGFILYYFKFVICVLNLAVARLVR